MATPEREPCPDRILDDVGGAFGMGAIGGSAFHFIKGIYNSPRGSRFIGGTEAVRMNAPRTGGSFAVWGMLFSVFDCSLVHVRQKEDPWNSIIAGAAAGGFLSMRRGLGAASKSAVFGGALLALIEGAAIMINKIATPQQQPPIFVDDPMAMGMGIGGVLPPGTQLPGGFPTSPMGAAEASTSSSSWFGGWFGGGGNKKEEEKKGGRGAKTEILESFDSPVPPTFEYK